MGAGYDLSVATFSPDGRVFQVEYATKAVDTAPTTLAIVCKDGILSALERPKGSKMLIPGSAPRIHGVDTHCSIAVCGFVADGRQIVLRARSEAAQYRQVYGEAIPGHVLAERIALFVHVFTIAWSIRPLGVGVLLSVYDNANGSQPELYAIDPAGASYRYFGMAFGKGRQSAKTEIEKLDRANMTCDEAVFHAARILQQIKDETKQEIELEMGWHCPNSDHIFQRVPVARVKLAQEEATRHLDAIDQE